MLEMCFSTAPSVTTSSRAIAAFVRPWAISSSVSRSRAVSASIGVALQRAVALAHQRADHLAVQRRAAGGDPADRVDERPDLGDPLLEQVADAALAGGQQLARVGRLDVLGEHQHRQLRMAPPRLQRRPDPLVGERRRQPHVADRQVGLVAVDDPQQPGPSSALATTSIPFSVSSATRPSRSSAWSSTITTRTPPAWTARSSRSAHGRTARTVVPSPTGLRTSSQPSSASTRWRRPVKPAAERVGAAQPLVGDDDPELAVLGPDRHPDRRARGVLGRVGQRLGDDEVGGVLDRRRRPVVDLGVDRDLRAGAVGQRLDRRLQARGRRAPAARSRGRGRAARRSPRSPPRGPGARARRRCVGALAGEPLLGASELHRQRDQPRLRAVVQVALDPPQLGGLDVERAAPGCGSARRRGPRAAVGAGGPRSSGATLTAITIAEHRPDRPEVAAAGHHPDRDQATATDTPA